MKLRDRWFGVKFLTEEELAAQNAWMASLDETWLPAREWRYYAQTERPLPGWVADVDDDERSPGAIPWGLRRAAAIPWRHHWRERTECIARGGHVWNPVHEVDGELIPGFFVCDRCGHGRATAAVRARPDH